MPPTNNVWASTTPTGETEELTTPTGQTCTAIKLGIENMIELGILTQADTLSATMEKHIRKVRGAKGKPDGVEVDEASLMADPTALRTLVTLADKALPHIVQDPVVKLHYEVKDGVQRRIPIEERDPESVYTDQVGFEDKMFLFDWAVGSLAKMDAFRDEPAGGVAHVGDGGSVPRPAKRTTRSKR